jgi:hypothetical protein
MIGRVPHKVPSVAYRIVEEIYKRGQSRSYGPPSPLELTQTEVSIPFCLVFLRAERLRPLPSHWRHLPLYGALQLLQSRAVLWRERLPR